MLFALLYVHMGSAFASLGLLLLRGGMQSKGLDWRQQKFLKILPHLSDTLLLLSGAILWWSFEIGLAPWLLAKLACLLGYIFFSAKTFSKKAQQFNRPAWLLASVCLSMAMLLGYLQA